MNLLKTIIERLNQRVEVANIFDQIYPLCELNANGNDKAWVHYIGNGQAEVVTNFDAKQGTLFWAKRGKVSVTKTESLKVSGCKTLYLTSFPLTAYAVVRKSHLPCDSEDSQDWIASRIYRLISGTDPDFKVAIGVIQYEVIPNGYVNEIKSLPSNYEWACVAVDVDINIVSSSEDGCYDVCATGDIPLPDFQPCTPCLTEVAVDGVTIIGNGTTADPLIAIGGGGSSILLQTDDINNGSQTILNLKEGTNITLTDDGVGGVTIDASGSGLPQSLQEVTDVGNTTDNDILFGSGVGAIFNNGAKVKEGTTDAGLGGAKGVAMICSNAYELKWEAGRLYYMEQNGFTIREVTHNFTITPSINDDSTKGFVVGSRWSLDNGDLYVLSDDTIGAAVWNLQSVGGVTDVTATSPLASSGGNTPDITITQADSTTDGYLSSTDWNTFDGKFDVPTGTITDYLDGLGSPQPFPTIPNAQVNSDWNATSGFAEILNKPSIPAAQIQSDWNQSNNVALDFIKNKPTIPNGSVTSVGLTMPSAFSVTNSPITTSGTLGVSANGLSSQYIRGDGQLANFPTSSGGGSSVSYYLNGSVAQGTLGGVAFKQISGTPVIGGGTDFTINANGYIQSFITDASVPNLLAIPAGNWNFEMYFSASSGGGSPSFYVELYKLSGGTLTLLASNSATPEGITNGTTIDLYTTAVAVPSTILLAADRLAIRVYVLHSSKTITLHTEDNHLCQVITTFSTGINALNGLTAQVQNLAVGTSGTDFAISSSTDTHTFNLPTASASNRGALSSADWSTFNGKQNAITTGTTAQYFRGDLSLATFPTIPVIYKSTADAGAFLSIVNTAVYTQLIAANTYTIGDIIRVIYRARKTGTNGIQILRIYVNTTADLLGTPLLVGQYRGLAANTIFQMQRHLAIKSSTANTEVFSTATTAALTDFAQDVPSTIVIDWTSTKYFVFALQNASALDTNYGSMYLIEKL